MLFAYSYVDVHLAYFYVLSLEIDVRQTIRKQNNLLVVGWGNVGN